MRRFVQHMADNEDATAGGHCLPDMPQGGACVLRREHLDDGAQHGKVETTQRQLTGDVGDADADAVGQPGSGDVARGEWNYARKVQHRGPQRRRSLASSDRDPAGAAADIEKVARGGKIFGGGTRPPVVTAAPCSPAKNSVISASDMAVKSCQLCGSPVRKVAAVFSSACQRSWSSRHHSPT